MPVAAILCLLLGTMSCFAEQPFFPEQPLTEYAEIKSKDDAVQLRRTIYSVVRWLATAVVIVTISPTFFPRIWRYTPNQALWAGLLNLALSGTTCALTIMWGDGTLGAIAYIALFGFAALYGATEAYLSRRPNYYRIIGIQPEAGETPVIQANGSSE